MLFRSDVGVIQEVKPSGRGSNEVNLTVDVEEYLDRPEREKGPVHELNRESIAEFGMKVEVIPEQETERVKTMEGGAIYTTREEECAHLTKPKKDTDPKKVLWIGDSGASMHMGGSCEGMYDARPCDMEISVGDGKMMKGKLNVKFEIGDGKY